MKKLMIALFSMSILVSCEKVNKNVLNTAEGIDNIKSLVMENFGDREVYRLNLYASPELSSDLASITINYLENEVDYSQTYLTQIEGKKLSDPDKSSTQGDFFLKNKQGKAKVSSFDFSLIHKNFKEACGWIDGYENFHLHTWYFEVDNDNNTTCSFTIHATKTGENTERSGNMEITNYYEFFFDIDKEGNLTIKE